MEQSNTDTINQTLKSVLDNLCDTIIEERRASKSYKNLFKKSDDTAEFLRDVNHKIMKVVLDATQVLRDKCGTCPNEVYNILKCLPFVTDYMEKRIMGEEGMFCCVDKVYYLLSQKVNGLLETEEENEAKVEELKKEESVVILNSKFEEAEKAIDASYAIYDNNEIEFYTPYDTAYPIITAEEIQKLAEILKREEKRKTPIQIFLHVYDKWGIDPIDTEVLEDLEDSIRDLLQSKGFSKFNIEDGYTGNSTTAHGREEEQ